MAVRARRSWALLSRPEPPPAGGGFLFPRSRPGTRSRVPAPRRPCRPDVDRRHARGMTRARRHRHLWYDVGWPILAGLVIATGVAEACNGRGPGIVLASFV